MDDWVWYSDQCYLEEVELSLEEELALNEVEDEWEDGIRQCGSLTTWLQIRDRYEFRALLFQN